MILSWYVGVVEEIDVVEKIEVVSSSAVSADSNDRGWELRAFLMEGRALCFESAKKRR